MSTTENSEKKNRSNQRGLSSTLFELIIISLFIYFYFLFLEFGINPFLISIILLFILLLLAGPLLRGKQNKRLYSKMFPDKKNRIKDNRHDFRVKDDIQLYKESPTKNKILKNINLDFEYKKPLINKCVKCGMILTNFVKKCPVCKTPVEKV